MMKMRVSGGNTPAWQRYLIIGLVGVLALVAVFVVYTKEFKKSDTTSSSTPTVTVTTVAGSGSPPKKASVVTTTTIPGGIAVSPNSPFAQTSSSN
jgi:hypothetical protein